MEACAGGRPWCYSGPKFVWCCRDFCLLTAAVLKVWKGRSKERLPGALPVTTKTLPPSYVQVTKSLIVPRSVKEL